KGWGLRVLEDVKADQLLVEYVGEVIGPIERAKRMQEVRQHPRRIDAASLYVMQLAQNLFLDAKRKGGVARFINHSCEPTCRLDRWRAGGRVRCAVFAKRDLAAGTELSFDYQWGHHKARQKTKCLCGAPACRGFI
ncbi:hypothetical protein JKP88DRAFT_152738, partial [Tribonema minus]